MKTKRNNKEYIGVLNFVISHHFFSFMKGDDHDDFNFSHICFLIKFNKSIDLYEKNDYYHFMRCADPGQLNRTGSERIQGR
jgi:hypothetical protein